MDQNVTFLGTVADDFDSNLRQAEHVLDDYVEAHRYTVGSMLIASTTIAFMRFGQSYADLLRIGNGLFHGGWKGAAQDGLRIITIAGVGGAALGRISRILAVTQKAGTFTCTWITTANMLQRTGQRFFIAIEELAESANVDLKVIAQAGGSTAAQCKRLITGLRAMNVAVEEIAPNVAKVEVLSDLLKARPNGALAFAVEAGQVGKRFGHQLFATLTPAGLVIQDTSGTAYRSLNAFNEAYKDATLVPGFMFFIKNAALISGAEIARTAGGLSGLVLELLPLMPKNQNATTIPGIQRHRR